MSDVEQRVMDEGFIVVGIDGSDGSRAALEFAMDEAVLRHQTVRAVMVYEPPDLWIMTGGVHADMQGLRRAVKETATAMVESVTEARTQAGEPVPTVESDVQHGPATPGARAAVPGSDPPGRRAPGPRRSRESTHRLGRAELRDPRPLHSRGGAVLTRFATPCPAR